MFDYDIYDKIHNETSRILLTLSIMLLAGFLLTRITKLLKLPNVSGYIIAGIIIGPELFHLTCDSVIDKMEFISDIALAFIAFGVGKFFKKEVLKKAGIKIIIITAFEALLAMLLITLMMRFVFKMSWSFSLLLGALASATAPASTMMTIKQYKAEGHFVEVLLQVVAIDDIICLLAFSIASSIASNTGGSFSASDILLPLLYNILVILIAVTLAIFLRFILNAKRSKNNRLILVIMSLLLLCGICAILDVSPLLSCMIFATVYINITDDDYLFHQIDNFTPPIMLLFFVLSGMRLDLGVLKTVGIIGICYFLVRIVAKYLGSLIGCQIVHETKAVKYNLGLALIPQAGVAIGLSVLASRILPTDLGIKLSTIILSSSILYEFVGPASAKLSLFLSGSIKKDAKFEHVIEGSLVNVPTIDEHKNSFLKNNQENIIKYDYKSLNKRKNYKY